MAGKVRALVLRAAGVNCDEETAYALELAGAAAERIHINALAEGPQVMDNFQILVIPGGFSFGDDISAGRILAQELTLRLRDEVARFAQADKLVLGICNGFQVLVKTGMLPAGPSALGDTTSGNGAVTLTNNDSGRFECRWVYLSGSSSRCVFTRDLDASDGGYRVYLPVAHAEGKLVADSDTTITHMQDNDQIVFRYCNADGSTPDYPANPNGSQDHIAACCDPTGRIMGMMPHPERFVRATQHPRWTSTNVAAADGLKIFTSAVRYCS